MLCVDRRCQDALVWQGTNTLPPLISQEFNGIWENVGHFGEFGEFVSVVIVCYSS